MTLYTRLSLAIEQGMNIKLALLATGLDEKTFWQYYDEQMFNSEQVRALMVTVNEWRRVNL